MAGLDDEWNEALDEEYGDDIIDTSDDAQEDKDDIADDTTDDDAADKDDASDDTDAEDTDDEDEAEDEEADEDAEEPDKDGEDEESEDADDDAEEEAEKPQTREEIKAALRELEAEGTERKTSMTAVKDEVLEALYPEGVDRQLRDADGDPINGIQDLTGVDPLTGKQVGEGLINPVTGELFTEEEAGRYILRGQQKLNEQVELMEGQAYNIAEVHMSLKDSSERVEAKFGKILDALPPEISKQISEAYIKTLQRDPKSGLVIGAPLDAFEFYSIALAGADAILTANPPKQKPAPKAAPEAKKPADKGDRADLGRRGTATRKSKDDEEWDAAMDEILG